MEPNLPAEQFVHAAVRPPPRVEYVPGAHTPEQDASVAPPVLYRPAAQGVQVGDVALPGEKEPAGQGAVHAADVRPVVLPKTPAGQGVHAADVAPPVEWEPGAHDPVRLAVVMPSADPYVPGGHSVHMAELAPPAE